MTNHPLLPKLRLPTSRQWERMSPAEQRLLYWQANGHQIVNMRERHCAIRNYIWKPEHGGGSIYFDIPRQYRKYVL